MLRKPATVPQVRQPSRRHHLIQLPAGANNRGRPDAYAGHPKSVYLREDALLEAVSALLSASSVSAAPGLAHGGKPLVDDRGATQRQAQRDQLQRALDGLSRQQGNILRQAENTDSGDPFTKGLRTSYNRRQSERAAALATLAELNAADAAEPLRPAEEDADLLAALPSLVLNLVRAPQQLLRRLFEVIQLTVQLHYYPNEAAIRITLPADMSLPTSSRPRKQCETSGLPLRGQRSRGPQHVQMLSVPPPGRAHADEQRPVHRDLAVGSRSVEQRRSRYPGDRPGVSV